MVQNHTNGLSERAKRAMREPQCITRKIYEIIKKLEFFVYAPTRRFSAITFCQIWQKKSTEKSFPSVDCSEGKETLKDTLLLLSFLHQHHEPHRSLSQILISCVSARQEAYHVQSGGA